MNLHRWDTSLNNVFNVTKFVTNLIDWSKFWYICLALALFLKIFRFEVVCMVKVAFALSLVPKDVLTRNYVFRFPLRDIWDSSLYFRPFLRQLSDWLCEKKPNKKANKFGQVELPFGRNLKNLSKIRKIPHKWKSIQRLRPV